MKLLLALLLAFGLRASDVGVANSAKTSLVYLAHPGLRPNTCANPVFSGQKGARADGRDVVVIRVIPSSEVVVAGGLTATGVPKGVTVASHVPYNDFVATRVCNFSTVKVPYRFVVELTVYRTFEWESAR